MGRHPRDAPTVIVTDADARASLAVCRDLDAAGFRVAVVFGTRRAPATWSRSRTEGLALPGEDLTTEEGLETLASAVARGSYSLLIPSTDQSLRALSAHRDRFEEQVRLALPPHRTVLDVLNKVRLEEASEAIGMPAPETVHCGGPTDALAAAERLGYPVVLKPRRVVTTAGLHVRRNGSQVAWGPDELLDAASTLEAPMLVQRSMPGDVISCAGVRVGGEHLALAVSRAIRNWPPGRGGWSYSITIEPPEGLAEGVGRLLDHLGWEGTFEVELIAGANGSFSAIDLNPRPYGSLALASAAGANLPAAWANWVLGRRSAPAVARAGVRYRWEDAEVRWVLRLLRRRQWWEAAAVARPRRATAHAYFRWTDPAPLAARVLQAMSGRTDAQARHEMSVRLAETPDAHELSQNGHRTSETRRLQLGEVREGTGADPEAAPSAAESASNPSAA